MTGLDLDKDGLVEVAVVITDEQLNVVDPGIDIVIRPSQEALDNMGDFVRNMHTESGLIDEFETGVSLEEAQREVLDYVKKFVPQPRQALLAGNSIGTDKAFLERDMPELIDYLHYRVVDVSSIKELAKRWYHRTFEEAPAKHGGHRALADILESIQELVYYRRVLFPQGEGPSRQEARQVAAEVIALGIPNIE
ncbi:oligoribonuclease [Actinomyces sp. HMSC065F11]|nr:oligoribonuclease [Actinomyces sp. HMSC075B09]OFR31011.1 oligoribonuclease [Actinomyces sp. HMSC065F11]